VADPQGFGAGQEYDLTVFTTNSAPSVISTPPVFAGVGALYTYEVEATDREGDPLSFSLDDVAGPIPAGVSVDMQTGVIS
jgi:hypothetical protein